MSLVGVPFVETQQISGGWFVYQRDTATRLQSTLRRSERRAAVTMSVQFGAIITAMFKQTPEYP